MENQMTMSMIFGFTTVIVGVFLARRSAVTVNPYTTTLILRFGKVVEMISKPGLSWRPGLLIPGTSKLSVSHSLEGIRIEDIHVNDRDGTTMRINLWLECRVSDARASLFEVENWRHSIRGMLKHSLMSAAGTRRFENIISDRSSLIEEVIKEAHEHAVGWGNQNECITNTKVHITTAINSKTLPRAHTSIETKIC